MGIAPLSKRCARLASSLSLAIGKKNDHRKRADNSTDTDCRSFDRDKWRPGLIRHETAGP